MGEQEIPAGLGKLYFTTAEDKNLEHLQEVELIGHRIDFKDIDIDDDSKNHWGDNDGKGWAVTATARPKKPTRIDRMVEWLYEQLHSGRISCGYMEAFVADFRKAMEKEYTKKQEECKD